MQAVEDLYKNFPTGCGPKPELGPYSSLVSDLVGEDSPSVIDISCGVESGTREETAALVSVASLPLTAPALPPTAAPPLPPTAENPLPPTAEACLLEPASLEPPEPTFTGLDVDNSQPTQSPQDRSSSHPLPANCVKCKKRMLRDVNTQRCRLLTAKIEKLLQETQKIQAERKKKNLKR